MPNSPFILLYENLFSSLTNLHQVQGNFFSPKNMQNKNGNITFKHQFFFLFAVLGITLRFSGWMFQPTGAISYTCQPCIFFILHSFT